MNEPRSPKLPAYQYGQPSQRDYYSGGSGCKPEILSRLTGQKALSERDRCAEYAENHRHDSDDLVQQTRAADAASASAISAYEQTRLMLLEVIGGVITLIAAAFAAIYARKAFLIQDHSFRLLARPFLYVDKVSHSEAATEFFEIVVTVKNCGSSPATNVRVKLWTEFLPVFCEQHTVAAKTMKLDFIAPNTPRQFVRHVTITQEDREAAKRCDHWLFVTIDLTFDTRFVKDKRLCEQRVSFGSDFLDQFWFPSKREDVPADQLELFDKNNGNEKGDAGHSATVPGGTLPAA